MHSSEAIREWRRDLKRTEMLKRCELCNLTLADEHLSENKSSEQAELIDGIYSFSQPRASDGQSLTSEIRFKAQ